jgi:hypothetical protein
MNHTTPFYSLPPELVSLIFDFAKRSLPTAKSRRLPLILSHVTRRWRDIAICAGFLWIDIDISPPWMTEMVEAYLIRSGSYPIDVSFIIPPPHKIGSISEIDRVFSLITPHLARCRTFYVGGSLFQYNECPAVATLVERVSAQALPQLKQLSLDRTGASKTPLFFNAPSLTHLCLSGSRSISPNLALDSITTLHLSIPMSFSQFTDTLTSCTSLSTLAIYDRNISEWPRKITETPVPTLRSLQVYGHRMCKVSELLLAISAPALHDLVIAPVVPSDLSHLRKTWPAKFPSLSSLTLAPAHSDAFDVLPVAFECFPTVKHLAFANIYHEGFASMFADQFRETLLWPELQSIAFRDVNPQTEYLVGRMVSLRKDRGHPLQKLRLDARSFERLPALRQQIAVETLDVWKGYQERALYRDVENQFLGRPDDV